MSVSESQSIVNQQKENSDLKMLQQVSFESTNVHNPTTLQEYINIAKMMAASGYYGDIRTAQQAVAVMILGRHFGLSPVQALTGIHIVKGKPMLHYAVILSKVREHPNYDYKVIEKSANRAVLRIFNKLTDDHDDSIFTKEMATKRGTQNMDKMPEIMLLARATSEGVRTFCPDVLMGMPVYVQGEIPDDSEYGDTRLSSRDRLKAELQAKIAESDPVKADAMDAEARELPPDDPPKVNNGGVSDLHLSQKEVIEVSKRLTFEGAPSATDFIKQCRESGMRTWLEVSEALDKLAPVPEGGSEGAE